MAIRSLRTARTGMRVANAVIKSMRHEKAASEQGVCFKMPVASLNTIKLAAQIEHRSMSNFMWHYAVVAAERILRSQKS